MTKHIRKDLDAPASVAQAAPRLDLERYVPGLLTFLANKLSRGANAVYQNSFGVNVTEWRIMSLLAIEPGIAASRICQVIGYDKGPVSRTLEMMRKRDLIMMDDDPRDARRHKIALTEQGLVLHDAMIRVALDRESRLLSCLNASERAQLITLLNALHSNLGAVAAPVANEALSDA